MDIGRVGVWTFQLDMLPATRAQEVASEIEILGYGALWIPEAMGKEAFTSAGILLAGTRRLVVATGIANMWGRDPMTAAAAQKTLGEAYPDRFLLGLGVSHQPLVEGVRGTPYSRPLSAMRDYLDRMDVAPYLAAAPPASPPRVLAALGPKMLELAAARAWGAHPYFVPPEHTATAREVMGPDAVLAPEQAVVIETDPEIARRIARAHMGPYLNLPNYVNNIRRLGFSEEDVTGVSDRLVDAVVAWGSLDDVVARIGAHHDAGADHVCIQVLGGDPKEICLREWRELAGALRGP